MPRFPIQAAVASLGFAATVLAAIGPVTNLDIVNTVIAPDGFPRSLVLISFTYISPIGPDTDPSCRTVLAGGQFPGPLIQGIKVFGPELHKGFAAIDARAF